MREQRILAVAFATFMFLLGGLVIAFLITTVIDNDEHETILGRYDSPRQILQTRPGIEGPAVTQEGMVQARGYRCLHAPKGVASVGVEMIVTYIKSGEDPVVRVPDPNYPNSPRIEVPRLPGCFNETILLTLPAKVTPGKWYIEAVEVNPMGGELRFWYSEEFTVVGRLAVAIP
jgi:hypothetical protein